MNLLGLPEPPLWCLYTDDDTYPITLFPIKDLGVTFDKVLKFTDKYRIYQIMQNSSNVLDILVLAEMHNL